jgi:hypothetical protein
MKNNHKIVSLLSFILALSNLAIGIRYSWNNSAHQKSIDPKPLSLIHGEIIIR